MPTANTSLRLARAVNRVWSTDQIIDSLWGHAAPADRQDALCVYVSGLRTASEPGRPKSTDGNVILTRPIWPVGAHANWGRPLCAVATSARLRRLNDRMVTGDEPLEPRRSAQTGFGMSPGLTARRRELREEIGAGDFGVAYRAYEQRVGREVAIKVIRPELANDPSSSAASKPASSRGSKPAHCAASTTSGVSPTRHTS